MHVTRAVKCEDVTEEIITESTAVEFWWFTVALGKDWAL